MGAIHGGISEFGNHLAELVTRVPGARGAVLTDGSDEIIDSAHDPTAITELDLQISGAQLGQSLAHIHRTAIVTGLGHAVVILAGSEHIVIAAILLHEYRLTLRVSASHNLNRALDAFVGTRDHLLNLLR